MNTVLMFKMQLTYVVTGWMLAKCAVCLRVGLLGNAVPVIIRWMTRRRDKWQHADAEVKLAYFRHSTKLEGKKREAQQNEKVSEMALIG